jgi:hypothetical protein
MAPTGLDPRLTFDAFVVGPANRLPHAAAQRAAQNLGAAYNPLVLHGAAGLGKTHLLMALGNRVAKLHPQLGVLYANLAQLLENVSAVTARGALREQLRGVHVLLLDDAQMLAGRPEAQEELLVAWDAILARGGQIAIAADRPPTEIDALDRRLASRFAAGLIAELTVPGHETRLSIVTRRAAERGQRLAAGVDETLARMPFASVRELQGALNRVIATQELESRTVRVEELAQLVGSAPTGQPVRAAEFGSFLSDVQGSVEKVIDRLSPEQRLAEAILRWEGEGYRTLRLDAALKTVSSTEEADRIVRTFEQDVAQLRAAEEAIRSLDANAPELARTDVLRDPDMVPQAGAMVLRTRQRLARGPVPIVGIPGRFANGASAILRPPRNGLAAPPPREGSRIGAPAPAPMPSLPETLGPAATNGGITPAAGAQAAAQARPKRAPFYSADAEGVSDRWFLTREKVLWDWPYAADAIVTE